MANLAEGHMRFARHAGLCVALCQVMFGVGLKPQALDTNATPASKTYADSQSGIEKQFADLLQIVRSNDQPAIRRALDTLGIPDSNEWIAARFDANHAAEEQQSYKQGLEKFQSHVWWVMGNFGKYPNFALKIEESQIAPALSDQGFEILVPRPKEPVRLQTIVLRPPSTIRSVGHRHG
jgi:hypothetical protein